MKTNLLVQAIPLGLVAWKKKVTKIYTHTYENVGQGVNREMREEINEKDNITNDAELHVKDASRIMTWSSYARTGGESEASTAKHIYRASVLGRRYSACRSWLC